MQGWALGKCARLTKAMGGSFASKLALAAASQPLPCLMPRCAWCAITCCVTELPDRLFMQGPGKGTPCIDDYIKSAEPVYDYLTKFRWGTFGGLECDGRLSYMPGNRIKRHWTAPVRPRLPQTQCGYAVQLCTCFPPLATVAWCPETWTPLARRTT